MPALTVPLMIRRVLLLLPLVMCLACVLVSCGLFPDPTVRLLTDRAEIAAYVERFNVVQDDCRVEIDYRDSPSQAVLDGAQADAVIGKWLATPQVMAHFEQLSDIVKPGRIDPSQFYSGLLAMGSKDNRPLLIPISFDLPAVVFLKSDVTSELPAMILPLEKMRAMSLSFNTSGKNGFSAMGFSPLWNQDFLQLSCILFGTHFRSGRNGVPAWEPEGLARTMDFLRSWLLIGNGGKEELEAFSERNLVQPYYKLLRTGKILFALTPFSEFFSLPEDKRRDLDFRWPSSANLIPAQDDVLFAGILRTARNKRGAKAFFEWFFSIQNQRRFLEIAQSRRIAVFGISNGFSSLKSINEKDISQKYSLALGHIPSENFLLFPDTLPDNWVRIRDEVVRKWIAETIKGEEEALLSVRIGEWQTAANKKGKN